MAKSDLLKEAIADAKAVKETALANAKIALQEAFAPRIQNMLSAKLSEDLTEEEEMDMATEEEMDDMGDAGMGQDVGDISIDMDGDGDMDFEGDIYAKDGGMDDMEDDMEDDDMEDDMEDEMSDDEMMDEYNEGDMGLDDVIRELEEDMAMNDEEEMPEEAMPTEVRTRKMNAGHGKDHHDMEEEESNEVYSESIDDIINEILAEEEEEMSKEEMNKEEMSKEHAHGGKKDEEMKNEIDDPKAYTDGAELTEALTALEESYKTVKHLKSVINEVNLLNAKLLYTNKLFRNFELSESQKMKVIENFDRATTTRETKLVFTTLAESFNKPAKKRVVKESYASRASTSTAPSKEFKENTQILSEGFEHANRWKKLAGLI